MRSTPMIATLLGVFAAACTPNSPLSGTGGSSGQSSTGGATSNGGTSGNGGTTSKGGTTGSGGATGNGGTAVSGGTTGSGGSSSSGGLGGSGGASGGTSGSGGKSNAGGATGPGGSSAAGGGGASNAGGAGSGGAGGTGGTIGAGGASSTGGANGGTTGTGGATNAGGAPSTGGASGMAGSGGSAGGLGLCASAFFSADAAAKKATEYTSWKTAFVQECTADKSAVVKNGGGVYSEGIGYGMLLAASNDDQPLLDKLWKFYTDHYDKNGLMNWSMDACTAPGNNNANAASDGDLDAAMGLVLADKKWGGYTSKAQELIGKIKKFETDTCSNGLVILRPGDNWGGCTESPTKGKTNPSYFAPGYYRAFATIDTANAAFWTQLAADSYTLLAKYQTAMNGLVPEWGFSDGTTEANTYDYNACRTPWRIAVDYMWYCTPEAKTVLQKFSTYVDGKGGVTKTGYANNSAFVGAFADSGIAVSQAKIDSYVKEWLGAAGMDDTPYFQGTLRRLYLLVAGGQFLMGK